MNKKLGFSDLVATLSGLYSSAKKKTQNNIANNKYQKIMQF